VGVAIVAAAVIGALTLFADSLSGAVRTRCDALLQAIN